MNTVVDRPIFIIATGRAGSTMMFKPLPVHPELAWPSQHLLGSFSDRYDIGRSVFHACQCLGTFRTNGNAIEAFMSGMISGVALIQPSIDPAAILALTM